MTLAERLQRVEQRVADACRRANRRRSSVHLVAVSKRKPATDIREAYDLGQRDFGENYIQELLAKQEQLSDLSHLRWHMIGHLQRNKARHLVGAMQHGHEVLLHTIDDTRLVRELQKRMAARLALDSPSSGRLPVLIEVNVAGELQKSGCQPGQLPELLEAFAEAPALHLQGLMTIPPLADSVESSRVHFAALRELKEKHCPTLPRLSMGMSQDFEVAIEEGATDVRVGTAIFGKRD